MYKEHRAFKKPADEDIKIWRYLDFTKFVSLLDKRALFFCRADRLSDPFEGSYSKANILLRPKAYQGTLSEKNLKDISDIQRNLKKNTVMNCWHINEYESAAMWRLYLKSDEGIAIQSTFKRLVESFNDYPEDVYIGQVKYVDYKRDIIPEGNLFYPYTHKRKSFEYERELRAVIGEMPVEAGKFDSKKELFDVGAYIPVYLDVLVERIFLPPQAPNWFGELVKSIIEKYDLKKEVVQSNLDEDPVY